MCRKRHFVVLLVSEVRLTRHYGDFKLSVALTPIIATSQTFELNNKTKSLYTLYRRPSAAGQHHTMPPGKMRGESTHRSLPSYTNLSVSAVSTISSSSALHCSNCSVTLFTSTLGPRSHCTMYCIATPKTNA